jgi:hypothetical protein
MAESPRSTGLPELAPDAQRAVNRHLRETFPETVALISTMDPLLEAHRGTPLPSEPRSSDEALELLYASSQAGAALRGMLTELQSRWALDAVLHGAKIAAVANALGLSAGAVSRRWPFLGKMQRSYVWFRTPCNAEAWARACVALQDATASIQVVRSTWGDEEVGAGLEPISNSSEVQQLVSMAQNYLDAVDKGDPQMVSPQWLEMIGRTTDLVETLLNPRRAKGTSEQAVVVLNQLRLVWRAYRAAITVEDQIKRDEQLRGQLQAVAARGGEV